MELTDDELQVKTRPLTFDSERHKVLNSELKYLYTAITRARVNVWFFDEDEASRAPIFEYFQRLGLVRVVRMSGSAGDPEPLTSMFVEKSTTAEWREQGGYFYSKRLWEVAIKCFTMAGDELMARKSHAQLQAAEAGKLRSRPKEMRTQFLGAAEQFLQCAMVAEAAVCLYNARERVLLAKLNKRLGNVRDHTASYRARTVRCGIVPYRTASYRTVRYCRVPYRIVSYRAVPPSCLRTWLHTTPYHFTIPYRTVTYHTQPRHTALHIVLFSERWNRNLIKGYVSHL